MSRGLWFAAGAGAGAYALTRARRVAESFTADGLRDRLTGLSLGARLLREEVRAGQAEKEAELRERFGLAPAPGNQLGAPPATPPRALPRHDRPDETDQMGNTADGHR